MSVITINENSFDPATPTASGLRAEDASKSDYILIQTEFTLSLDQTEELTKLGVDVHKYCSTHT